MIEKLDHADIVPREAIVAKINELIDAVNKLEYHIHLGEKYPPTYSND